jgi:hypothetical protein
MKQTIPTVIVKTGWEKMPERPFIMKTSGGIYRYGNRYNVVTDNRRTKLIDMKALAKVVNKDNVADDVHIREVELITAGKTEYVVVNGRRYTIPEILTAEDSV